MSPLLARRDGWAFRASALFLMVKARVGRYDCSDTADPPRSDSVIACPYRSGDGSDPVGRKSDTRGMPGRAAGLPGSDGAAPDHARLKQR